MVPKKKQALCPWATKTRMKRLLQATCCFDCGRLISRNSVQLQKGAMGGDHCRRVVPPRTKPGYDAMESKLQTSSAKKEHTLTESNFLITRNLLYILWCTFTAHASQLKPYNSSFARPLTGQSITHSCPRWTAFPAGVGERNRTKASVLVRKRTRTLTWRVAY